MHVQIQKWGNSLAIRIPKSFAKQIKVSQGSFVDLSTFEGKVIAKPLDEIEYSLEQLLGDVTKKNLHTEIDTGNAMGKEVW